MTTFKKITMLSFIIFSLILIFTSCKHTTEPKLESKAELNLTLEDVSCTEAWVMLKPTNLPLPATVTIYKNNAATENNILCYGDTVLYVDSLLPNQTYSFYAAVEPSSYASQLKSNVLNVTTLDTTTHNFTFQNWTFGTIGSSTLYDVAIINENDIWAVGEINIADTSINGYTTYNAVHWNGTEWELKKIYTYSACSSVDYAPLKSIYAFSENSIVVTSGGGMWWYDGTSWKAECSINPLLTGAINKLWGSSSNDLYAVGNGGNIAHWDGRKWTKIKSGTTLSINDIWGDFNEKTGEWEILAVASNVNSSTERQIIKINNNNSQIILSSPIQWSLRTVWFAPSKKYYVAGSGIYEKHSLNESIWKNNPLDITTYYTNRIRGNGINDIVGIGAYGDFLHFNGIDWEVNFIEPTLNFGSYLSLAIKEDIVVAVGLEYNQAVILTALKINQ